jgi:AraC family transcriptional regulator
MKTIRPITQPSPALRVSAQQMPQHLPDSAYQGAGRRLHKDVQIQVYTHSTVARSIVVPAVAEPLLVLVLSGTACVQEREFGQAWSTLEVTADDFFLTMTHTPYEMRWQIPADGEFQVVHVYLSQRLLDLAGQRGGAGHERSTRLADVSGARDPQIAQLVRFLHQEMVECPQPSALYVDGIAQALAVHLVRHYRDDSVGLERRNALPAYRLHRVIKVMESTLENAFSLSALAQEADLSDFYFSRLFHQATGHSPSQYFIQLRMARARRLLSSTTLSIIEVALEVGYGSPGHFAQVFKRHTGMTPRAYRRR